MEIVSKTEGSKVTMEITGWLDTQTAPQLEKELSARKEGFRIVNVSDEVYDVFSLTGFDQKINIEKK